MRIDPLMVLTAILEIVAEETDNWMKKGHTEIKVALLLLGMFLLIGLIGND